MSESMRQLAQLLGRVEQLERQLAMPVLPYSSLDDAAVPEKDADGQVTSVWGRHFDGTHGMVDYTGPTPPTPTSPVIEPTAGGLVVGWDGGFASGEVAPLDFTRIEVHVSLEPGFTPVRETVLSSIESPQGATVYLPLPAVSHYVRLVARSRSGKGSPATPEVAGTPLVLVDEAEVADLADRLAGLDIDVAAIGATATAAQSAAADAHNAAVAAAADAADANAEALAAAGLAESKGEVIYQVSAPTGSRANPANLWIRSSDNKPHTYNGTTWVAVESAVATNAAAAAAAAQTTATDAVNAAAAAQTTADAAAAAAAVAQGQADVALTTANGKNKITFSGEAPTGAGPLNDVWFRMSGSIVIGQWRGTGTGWDPQTIDDAVIANLNAAKIVAGVMSAARVAVGTTTNALTNPDLANSAASGWSNPEWITDGAGRTTGQRAIVIPQSSSLSRSDLGSIDAGAPAQASRALYAAHLVPDRQYRASVWVRSPSQIRASRARIDLFAWQPGTDTATSATFDNLATIPADTWGQITGVFTVPAGMFTQGVFGVQKAAAHSTGQMVFTEPVLQPMTGSVLIQNGAVTADKLAATIALIGTIIAGTPGGGRVELGSFGLRKYAANGTTIEVDFTTADAIFSGRVVGADILGSLLRTAVSGQRVEIGGDQADRVRFYSGAPAEQAPGHVAAGLELGRTFLRLQTPQSGGQVATLDGSGPEVLGFPYWYSDSRFRLRDLDAPTPHARYVHTTARSKTLNRWQILELDDLDTVDYVPAGPALPWILQAIQGRVLINRAGVYNLVGYGSLLISTFAVRVRAVRGGTDLVVTESPMGSGAAQNFSTGCPFVCHPGDYVYVEVYPSATTNTRVHSNTIPCGLSITRLSTIVDDTW